MAEDANALWRHNGVTLWLVVMIAISFQQPPRFSDLPRGSLCFSPPEGVPVLFSICLIGSASVLLKGKLKYVIPNQTSHGEILVRLAGLSALVSGVSYLLVAKTPGLPGVAVPLKLTIIAAAAKLLLGVLCLRSPWLPGRKREKRDRSESTRIDRF